MLEIHHGRKKYEGIGGSTWRYSENMSQRLYKEESGGSTDVNGKNDVTKTVKRRMK